MLENPSTTATSLQNDAWICRVNYFFDSLAQKSLVHVPRATPHLARVPKAQAHSHAHPEIFFQIEGSTHFIFPHEEIELKKNQVLIMPSGHPHAEKPLGGSNNFRHLVFMLIGHTCQLHVGVQLCQDGVPEISEAIHWTTPEGDGYNFLIKTAIANHKNDELCRSFLVALIALLREELHVIHPQTDSPALVRRAMQILQENAGCGDFNVTTLAKTLSCHPDHLTHVFRTAMGEGPKDVLIKYRMDLARRLLATTTLSVSRIAPLCGFNQSGYFSTVFTQREGMSPLMFRQKKSEAPPITDIKPDPDSMRQSSVW